VPCEQKTKICPNEQQQSSPNGELTMRQVLENIGAGEALRLKIFNRIFAAKPMA
jgi:hypothetical protein